MVPPIIHIMPVRRLARALISAALLASPVAAQDIHTGPPDDYTAYVGPSWYYTVGQVFTPQAPSNLASFSFYIGQHTKNAYNDGLFLGESGVVFTANIQAFDGSAPTGALLYSSAPQTFFGGPATNVYDDFQPITFLTGGIQLASGSMYIAFLQAIDDGEHLSNAALGYTTTALPAAGSGIYLHGLVGYPDQDVYAPDLTMSFDATFDQNAAPEPTTVVLLASGFLAMLTLRTLRGHARKNMSTTSIRV